MSHLYKLLSIRSYVSFLLFSLSAYAAFVSSESSAGSDLPPSFPSPNLNSSTLFISTTRCVLPVPPLVPVSLAMCQPTFWRILLAPNADIPHMYKLGAFPIWIVDTFGCVISLDRRGVRGEILISKRRIVEYARQVLLLCENFGQGGWTRIDGNEDWVVVVSGRRESGDTGK